MSRIVGWTFMSTGHVKKTVGWTFMSTGPIPELQENGRLVEIVETGLRVLSCLPVGGSIDTDTVDMNVHPTGRL